jgi:hypothetical protein
VHGSGTDDVALCHAGCVGYIALHLLGISPQWHNP